MSTPSTEGAAPAGHAERKRWLIGLSISVAFGLFGVVMALLAYFDRQQKPAFQPGAVPTIRTTPDRDRDPDPSPKDHGKGRGRN